MILLAIDQTWKKTWPFEYKYPVHKHNIHPLATTNYPISPGRNTTTRSSLLYSENLFTSLLPASPQIIKGENIQRLFRLQNCLSRELSISQKYSKTFQAASSIPAATSNHPATSIPAATSNHPASSIPAATSNQQQQSAAATSITNQQQQRAAATCSSNVQQQPAATRSSNQQQQTATAINSSNQQQQSPSATSSSNQHSSYRQHLYDQRRHLFVITTVPSRGYPVSSWSRTSCPVAECNHRTEAHFCYFSTFLKSFFCDFFLFLPRLRTDW